METKHTNQYRRARNAYPTRRSGALTNAQKAEVCILARDAYEARCEYHDFQQWRRGEQEKATGKPSLTLCTQHDYLPLKAHFLDLAGRSDVAFRLLMRHEDTPRELAMRKLEAECRRYGFALEYPAAICRRQYQCGLSGATPKQLWTLVFTVRNRGLSRQS